MLDALFPFVDSLVGQVDSGASVSDAWRSAADACRTAAEATASLVPKIGRARPLAERSVGTPDPGAISLGLIVSAIGEVLGDAEAATPGSDRVHGQGRTTHMSDRIRLLVGSDSAGFDYKDHIFADMQPMIELRLSILASIKAISTVPRIRRWRSQQERRSRPVKPTAQS
jgi:hypothetical protein